MPIRVDANGNVLDPATGKWITYQEYEKKYNRACCTNPLTLGEFGWSAL
jgi:hypothetical protein